MRQQLPLIFNIHRMAMDDGPGLRSTVFLKGCPLACDWCHNPEAMRPEAEVAFFPKLCIDCGACKEACPAEAIDPQGRERLIRSRCTGCGSCADACPATALRRVGTHYPVEDLMALLLRDKIFHQVSGGGVTFSGGEPTLHLDYLEAALTALSREGIPTAIQTCGHFSPDAFTARILPLVDLVFFDLKIWNSAEHARFTGCDNRLILDTFRRLTRKAREKIIPRIPLVPVRTATRDNLLALASFLKEQGHTRCDLLSYNPGGIEKHRAIGMMPPSDLPETLMNREEEETLRDFFIRELAGEKVSRPGKFFPAGRETRGNFKPRQGGEPCRSISIMR